MENKFKQIIQVPSRVTWSFFQLPCVCSACKCEVPGLEPLSFTVDATFLSGKPALKAYPGDYLCEAEGGGWIVLKRWDTLDIERIKHNTNQKNNSNMKVNQWHNAPEELPDSAAVCEIKKGGIKL